MTWRDEWTNADGFAFPFEIGDLGVALSPRQIEILSEFADVQKVAGGEGAAQCAEGNARGPREAVGAAPGSARRMPGEKARSRSPVVCAEHDRRAAQRRYIEARTGRPVAKRKP